MSVYFFPHLMFNSGYLIEFVCLKSDLINNYDSKGCLSLCGKNVLKSDFQLHKLFLDILTFVDVAKVKIKLIQGGKIN